MALQSSAPLLPSPWSLPSLGAVSAVTPDSGASSVQQLYLQQQQAALQQSLHTLLPLHPQLHTTGQTHTLLLQNQVRNIFTRTKIFEQTKNIYTDNLDNC